MSEPLACPSCGTTHALDLRFCPGCGMPLVYAGSQVSDAPITEQHERVRKVKPQYSEGDLVHVAGSRHQSEAEFIQGLLLEEGIPSMIRRTRGFDVPDMLAAGPRDVMVPASGVEAARQVLLQAEIIGENPTGAVAGPAPWRVLLWLVVGLLVVCVLVWLGTELQ
jgi:hypothetical protein